jgi:glycolate oxidase
MTTAAPHGLPELFTEDVFTRGLRRVVTRGRLLTDQASLERYAHDDAEWAPFVPPLAVVCAATTEEVAAVVRVAAEHDVRVVPRGGGTGLSGGANAVDRCLVLSLEDMRAVLRIDADERIVECEAGVVNDDLRAAVAVEGLWYPPDPASSSWSTVGGNAATNAGGICCVKYGVTGDYVLGLTVVLADGSIVRLGRRTAKGTVGYDLTSLMVGSEGTLGIITELTLKLLPLAGREERAVIGTFPSLRAAGEAVAAVSRAGILPAALELVDRTCLAAVDEWQGLGLPHDAEAMLLGKVDQVGEAGAALAEAMAGLFRAAGGTDVRTAEDPDAVERLFRARRLAYPALERLGPVLTEDVCVPRGAVPEMLSRIQAAAAEHDVVIANIAHAGDGNLHPLIIATPDDAAAESRAQAAFARIIDDCLALGGTVAGEHGVGLLKLAGAHDELGARVLEMHEAIKTALDPRRLLNPGKAFPKH